MRFYPHAAFWLWPLWRHLSLDWNNLKRPNLSFLRKCLQSCGRWARLISEVCFKHFSTQKLKPDLNFMSKINSMLWRKPKQIKKTLPVFWQMHLSTPKLYALRIMDISCFCKLVGIRQIISQNQLFKPNVRSNLYCMFDCTIIMNTTRVQLVLFQWNVV